MENHEDIVELKTGEVIFKCSKEVLTSSSDYFRAMFSGSYSESQQKIVEIKGVVTQDLKEVLKVISNESDLCLKDVASALSILQCASMLQFTEIQNHCEAFLKRSLSVYNCLELYVIASTYNLIEIEERALHFVLWFFKNVSDTDYFRQLAIHDVVKLLSMPGLNVEDEGEWSIWDAICKWVEADEDSRTQYTDRLLSCLCVDKLTQDDLRNLQFYDIITSNVKAKDIINFLMGIKTPSTSTELSCSTANALPTSLLSIENPTSCSHCDSSENLPCGNHFLPYSNNKDFLSKISPAEFVRKRELPTVPCLVCFRKDDDNLKRNSEGVFYELSKIPAYPEVFYLDLKGFQMKPILTLRKFDCNFNSCIGFRTCSVGLEIYITGGQYVIGSNHWNKELWSYNTVTDVWKCNAPLPVLRRSHSVCVLKSVIYLIGGYGKHRISLNSVDAFDTVSGTWLKCPDLPITGTMVSTAFDGKIFVFSSSILYFWDPKGSMTLWHSIELEIDYKFSFSNAISCGDFIYLVGSHSKSVYRVTPSLNFKVEFYGSFQFESVNVCSQDSSLVSFATFSSSDDCTNYGQLGFSPVVQVMAVSRSLSGSHQGVVSSSGFHIKGKKGSRTGDLPAETGDFEGETDAFKYKSGDYDGETESFEGKTGDCNGKTEDQNPLNNVHQNLSSKNQNFGSVTIHKISLSHCYSFPSDLFYGCFSLFKI